MSDVLILIFIFYLSIQIYLMIISMIEASIEFQLSGHNISLITARNIYEESNYNMTYCRILSFLKNLIGIGWNLGVIIYAIYYYLTRKGREGNFERR